jgi:hypothetical protein
MSMKSSPLRNLTSDCQTTADLQISWNTVVVGTVARWHGMRWPSCDLRGSRRRCRGPASAKAAGRLRRLHARGAPRQPAVIDGAHGEPFPEPVQQYGRYRVIFAKHR